MVPSSFLISGGIHQWLFSGILEEIAKTWFAVSGAHTGDPWPQYCTGYIIRQCLVHPAVILSHCHLAVSLCALSLTSVLKDPILLSLYNSWVSPHLPEALVYLLVTGALQMSGRPPTRRKAVLVFIWLIKKSLHQSHVVISVHVKLYKE